MQEEKHWDKIADKYEDEVLNAFESDKEKKLASYFKKHATSKVEGCMVLVGMFLKVGG